MQESNEIFNIQSEWLDSAKSIAGRSTKRALHVFSQLLFIEPGQFILEFLQNAEDARMELHRKGGFFKIELYNDKIVIEHNGKPFDENDLRNLCSIHTLKKPSRGYKGYIGIGWKSVFKVSSHIEVYSGQYSFMFSKSYWEEHRDDLIAKYGLKPEDVPWQVIPIFIQPTEYIPNEITRFKIYLDDPSIYEEIVKTVDNLKPPVFMFLDYINKIEVKDHVRGIIKSIEWFTHDSEEKEGVRIQKITLLYKENENKYYRRFLVFKKMFKVPNEVKEDRDTIAAERGDVEEREVAIAFALEDDVIKSIDVGQFWGVYSFLPLHEVRSGLRFLIQADFIVHPGRRSVNYEAKWNKWLMECVADLVKFSIKYLAEKYRRNYLEVFDYIDIISDPFYKELVRPTVIDVIEEELNDPEVICIKGHVVKLSKTVRCDNIVAELIKHGLVDEEDLGYIYKEEKHFLDPSVKLRGRDRIRMMEFTELLNKEYIKLKIKENLMQAFDILAKIYKLAFRESRYIYEGRKFIITRSGEVKLASEVYYSEIPEEIKDLMNKYPEIKEYIEKLDFIHEELVKRLDKEVLEWLNIKKISFNEIVEKTLLPRIYADSPQPSKVELLSITSIVKKARNLINKPIWVVSVNDEIKRSNEVYYPYQWFKPLELFIKAGIDFLDINAYLKYDGDENSWMKLFESAQIRGAQQCFYENVHQDYIEIISKLVNLINSLTDKNENIKYVRALKQLYQIFPKQLEVNLPKVKILRDDGRFAYSTECQLHDAYKPKEMWSVWRDKGFMIGSFVSPEYIDKADNENIYSWHRFFVKALGVKEEASKEDVERFALWFTRRKLEEIGYHVEETKDGYDLIVIEPNNETYYVEVKGRRKLDDIELTEKETEKAREYREKYWLIVVYDIPNNPRIKWIKDPIKLLTKIKIGKEQIESSEEL